MEFILHFMYVVAIKDTNAWYGDTAAELSMIGFWNLIIVWSKVSNVTAASQFTGGSNSSPSFLSRGASSDYGHSWMVSTRRRTWCGAWRTTIRPSGSGAAGTEAITCGSFGMRILSSCEVFMLMTVPRYIYIPLGGSKRVLLNSLLVFSFVALWHDLTFRLLAWGWLVSLFIVPEVAARFLLPSAKVRNRPLIDFFRTIDTAW